MKTPGQIAYETDCARRAQYHTSETRRTWAELPDYARDSWERNPTPRHYEQHRGWAALPDIFRTDNLN